MTEERAVYAAPDPRATIADRLFADVTSDAEHALQLIQGRDAYDMLYQQIGPECEDDDQAEYLVTLIHDASTLTVAHAMMQARGYGGVSDAWRTPDFTWWLESKAQLWKCDNIADVLRQYEEGGEPAYVKD